MTESNRAIRRALPPDTEALLDLQLTLDTESEFMLLSPGERDRDVVPILTRLRSIAEGNDPSYLLVPQASSSWPATPMYRC